MGAQVVYCYNCQKRLTEAAFKAGAAFQVGTLTSCADCVEDLLARLTPEQRRAVLARAAAAAGVPEDAPPEIPSRIAPPHGTTAHLRGRPGERRAAPPPAVLIVSVVAAGLIVILLLYVFAGRPSAPPELPRTRTAAPAAPPADPQRAAAAKAALQKARDHERAAPGDFDVLIRLYDDAVREADQTAVAEQARRGRDALTSRYREALNGDIAALEKDVRALAGQEEYQGALGQLASARPRYGSPEWMRAADRLAKEVQDAAAAQYAQLEAKAIEAQRGGGLEVIRKCRETVAKWGIPHYKASLEKALSESPAAASADAPSSAGLVFFLRFYEQGMNARAFDEASRQPAEVQGGGRWVTGRRGRALLFNGRSICVVAPHRPALNPTDAVTIAAWIWPDDWHGNRRIVQKGGQDNQYRLTQEEGQFKFDLVGVGKLVTTPPPTTGWHHVAATYDGRSMRIYFDGKPAAEQPAAGKIAATNDPLVVGTKFAGAPEKDYFKGMMEEVQIYNRALTAAEIAALGRTAE